MSEPQVYRPDQAKDPRAAEVLRFWFGERDEYGKRQKRWFKKDAAFDAAIRERFFALHEEALAWRLAPWSASAPDCLALIIVLDQFSRNLFRDDSRAFAADAIALSLAREAIARGIDRGLAPVERLFLYMPLMHSESTDDQRDCCDLMRALNEFEQTRDAHESALKHLQIIERFGRFPHRNTALGRTSTAQELDYLAQPGAGF